jgi:hypothetical protein
MLGFTARTGAYMIYVHWAARARTRARLFRHSTFRPLFTSSSSNLVAAFSPPFAERSPFTSHQRCTPPAKTGSKCQGSGFCVFFMFGGGSSRIPPAGFGLGPAAPPPASPPFFWAIRDLLIPHLGRDVIALATGIWSGAGDRPKWPECSGRGSEAGWRGG